MAASATMTSSVVTVYRETLTSNDCLDTLHLPTSALCRGDVLCAGSGDEVRPMLRIRFIGASKRVCRAG